MMSKLIKLLDERAEELFLVTVFSAVTILVIAQVFFRYVIQSSLGWSEEIARYTLVWITWISTSYAIKKRSHIRVELIKNFFSDTGKKVIEIIVLIAWFLFALFIAIEGTKLVLAIGSMGQVSPSTQLPMWFVYLAIPIGGTLMVVRLIQEFYKIFKGNTAEGGRS